MRSNVSKLEGVECFAKRAQISSYLFVRQPHITGGMTNDGCRGFHFRLHDFIGAGFGETGMVAGSVSSAENRNVEIQTTKAGDGQPRTIDIRDSDDCQRGLVRASTMKNIQVRGISKNGRNAMAFKHA